MHSLTTNEFYLLGLILLAPLLGAMINGLFGKRLPRPLSWGIAFCSVGLAFLLSLSAVATLEHSIHKLGVSSKEPQTSTQASQHPKRLTWTPYTWMKSGDWVNSSTQPHALFESVGPLPLQNQRVSSPTSDPTPNDQASDQNNDQSSIVSVSGALSGSAHRFGSLNVRMTFALDPLSAFMILLITGIGLLVQLFSLGSLKRVPENDSANDSANKTPHHFALLNLLCFSMLLLVLGGNFVVLFVGWVGVGLCAHFLTFSGSNSSKEGEEKRGKRHEGQWAPFSAHLMGDTALILGALVLFGVFGTFEFEGIRRLVATGTSSALESGVLSFGAGLLLVGILSKGGLPPFHAWVSESSDAPASGAAWIQSLLLGGASIYLLARLHFLFALTPGLMLVVALLGALTALSAALVALVQTDIKKVLAYSSISQLGLMLLAASLGAWWAAFFLFFTHACAKTLLVLGADVVIETRGERRLHKLGGLRRERPLVAFGFFVGCGALSGFPFFSGFFSQATLFSALWSPPNSSVGGLRWLLLPVVATTIALTALYMFRLYFRVFEGPLPSAEDGPEMEGAKETPTSALVSLVSLALLALFGGCLGVPDILNFFEGETLRLLPNWLQPLFSDAPQRADSLGGWMGLGSVFILALAGFIVAQKLYFRASLFPENLAARHPKIRRVLFNGFYLDVLFQRVVIDGTLSVAKYTHAFVDRLFIDLLSVRASGWMTQAAGHLLRFIHNGDMQRYATYLVLGLFGILYLMMF